MPLKQRENAHNKMVEKGTAGRILLAAGGLLYVLGLILGLDRLCLIVGNLCFLAGTGYVAGAYALFAFFLKPTKVKGTACYFLGFFLLLVGWVLLATGLQLYGVYILFKDFLPALEKQMPMLKSLSRAVKGWRRQDLKTSLPI